MKQTVKVSVFNPANKASDFEMNTRPGIKVEQLLSRAKAMMRLSGKYYLAYVEDSSKKVVRVLENEKRLQDYVSSKQIRLFIVNFGRKIALVSPNRSPTTPTTAVAASADTEKPSYSLQTPENSKHQHRAPSFPPLGLDKQSIAIGKPSIPLMHLHHRNYRVSRPVQSRVPLQYLQLPRERQIYGGIQRRVHPLSQAIDMQ
ncbi:hypothetical protein H4S06_000116 [Coemansia sp. BCRC 34490]|nr:hypothetical protein LPJ72_005865 [Coemansia sp. Benny D160-2]KAJ2763398.1 hypothetical protein H4S06_000116 [Coemansia sp. BCRC 34490]